MFSHVSDHVLKTFVKAYKKNVSKRKFKRPRACFQDVLKKKILRRVLERLRAYF